MAEKFNDVGPFIHPSDPERELMYLEQDPDFPDQHGKLWTGSTWLIVSEARMLRDWINKVIP